MILTGSDFSRSVPEYHSALVSNVPLHHVSSTHDILVIAASFTQGNAVLGFNYGELSFKLLALILVRSSLTECVL